MPFNTDLLGKVQLPDKSVNKLTRRNWLNNFIKNFLREFVFDMEESVEMIEQVNCLDRN